MGQHTWLLLATICTELLAIRKWSQGMFTEPFPFYVKLGWSIGTILLTVYPIVRVSCLPPLTLQPSVTEFDRGSPVWDSRGQEVHSQTTEEEWQAQSSLAEKFRRSSPTLLYMAGSGRTIQLATYVHTCTAMRINPRVIFILLEFDVQ